MRCRVDAGPVAGHDHTIRAALALARIATVTRRLRLLPVVLALGALAVAVQGCAHRTPARPPVTVPPAPPVPAPAPEAPVSVQVGGHVEIVPLEEYVAGCVAAELGSIPLPPAGAARARDVQAILCRSYAVASRGRHARDGFDLCSTTHCQLYRAAPATVIGRLSREAAARTAGLLVLWHGRPVQPIYHADCGGHTTTPGEVWGGPSPPYYVSAVDDACPKRPPWRAEVTLARLSDILRAAPGIALDGPLRGLAVERRDSSGRAEWVRLTARRPVVVRGADFRAAVTARLGAAVLPSTLFEVSVRAGLARFEGRGNGHGVGLCEAGMIVRAGRGDRPVDILAHYFPGTTIATG